MEAVGARTKAYLKMHIYGKCGIRHPVLLSFVCLVVLPVSTGYIDCRMSCQRCQENTESPSIVEVYCSMCDECKEKMREKMRARRRIELLETTSKDSYFKILGPASPRPLTNELSTYGLKNLVMAAMTATQVSVVETITHDPRAMRRGDNYGVPPPNVYPPMMPAPMLPFPMPPCPGIPMCSEEEEECPTTTSTTTTTPSTTTTEPSTKAAIKCVVKNKPMPMPMMPMPMFMPMMPACMPNCVGSTKQCCVARKSNSEMVSDSIPEPPIPPAMPATMTTSQRDTPSTNTSDDSEYEYLYVGIPKALEMI